MSETWVKFFAALFGAQCALFGAQCALIGVQERNAFVSDGNEVMIAVALLIHMFWIWVGWRHLMAAAATTRKA